MQAPCCVPHLCIALQVGEAKFAPPAASSLALGCADGGGSLQCGRNECPGCKQTAGSILRACAVPRSCSRSGWPAALTGPTWPRDQRDDVPFPPATGRQQPSAPHTGGSARRCRTQQDLPSCRVSSLPPPAARCLSSHADHQPGASWNLDSILHVEYAVLIKRAEPEQSRPLSELDFHSQRSRLALRRRCWLSKPSTIQGTLHGPKAGVRPTRAHFFFGASQRDSKHQTMGRAAAGRRQPTP